MIKTSTRQTIFLPVVGLVDAEKLIPGDIVGVNKDSYLILDTLPAEYDSRVKAMEVDEKPQEEYSDIGGLDKQIQEVTCRPLHLLPSSFPPIPLLVSPLLSLSSASPTLLSVRS